MSDIGKYRQYFTKEYLMGPNSFRLLDELIRKKPSNTRFHRTLFKTAAWWEVLLKNECGERCEITVKEAECFDIAWQEWFDTGHEYGIRDREFLQKGLDRILNFVLIYVRRK